MLATFRKIGGSIQGFLFKPTLESLEDGAYAFEMERIDLEKRSVAANRLYWGAICKQLADWAAAEGKGAAPSQDWFHFFFKKTCLPVVLAKRREGKSRDRKRERFVLPSGKVGYDSGEVFVSVGNLTTTDLTSKEFSDYVRLCCDVARTPAPAGLGYPYEFDFLHQ